jgi:hypothetical protein
VGSAPEVRFAGIEKGSIPDDHFARFTMSPVLEAQSTHTNGEYKTRYTIEGLIIIQVFTLRKSGKEQEAEAYARKLAVVARNIFRGRCFAGGIQFRNVRINDLAPEAKYNRRNVIAEYQYDELG